MAFTLNATSDYLSRAHTKGEAGAVESQEWAPAKAADCAATGF